MKKYNLIFALLFMAFSNPLWSAEVDTVWVSDFVSEIRFQHPVTNNLVLEQFNNLKELDSKNGQLIREIPFKTDWENKPYISPDGTKLLHTNIDDTYIYEYPNMELIIKLDTSIFSKFINNDEVILRKYLPSRLVKYNLTTNKEQIFTPEGIVQDIATSPDGRFISYSTLYIDGINEWSRLYLLDAKTMTQIVLLEEVKNTGHNYLRMSFSEDGKYLATNATTYYDDFQHNIYSTETLKPVKNYSPSSLKTNYLEIMFLTKDLYSLILKDYDEVNSKDIYKTHIIDINNDKSLITFNDTYSAILNSDLKHLYYRDTKTRKIICLNINNLINSASTTQMDTVVNYNNKLLTIKKENIRKVEISDISGRIILNKAIDNPISNNTTFSLNLVSGSYLINVITDKDSFTHKLMVME